MVAAAAGLDWLIGDPAKVVHPVVVMGWFIATMRSFLERVVGDDPCALRLGGGVITLGVVLGSGTVGWMIERLCFAPAPIHAVGWILLLIGLASSLAARSLRSSVRAVVNALPPLGRGGDLTTARQRLSWIVGRDVSELNEQEILRATAESASENAVDGLFAPLFWMLVGLGLWRISPTLPGPLALAWAFKASSTLDSMLGYRTGRLYWMGTAGARLDDLLTWVPCRIVMLTLPLVAQPWNRWAGLVVAAEHDGAPDPSPNAGRSEASFAHCAGIRLGGRNRYGGNWLDKPILAEHCPSPDRKAIKRVLNLNLKLELFWLLGVILIW
ncbi:MAG: cobalamin biosynthesis protein CobD [Cyanobium sp. SAT1300]|nr:cobalamin biosynthesis protein CobD [Cyanobium sp. SAT1300]